MYNINMYVYVYILYTMGNISNVGKSVYNTYYSGTAIIGIS